MRIFNAFVLDIPYLFLKKIPYAWVLVVILWTWPPIFSGIFAGIILLGLWFMNMQQRAWEAGIASEYRVLYRDEPRAPVSYQVRNGILVCVGSAIAGWLINGQFGLSAIQWTLLFAGLMFLYRDAILFGAGVVYLVTNKGIAVRFVPGHIDYRLFFRFDEILNIENRISEKIPPISWSKLTPRRAADRGLLLNPKNIDGFSKQIQEVFISPTNIEKFIEHFPPSVHVIKNSRQ